MCMLAQKLTTYYLDNLIWNFFLESWIFFCFTMQGIELDVFVFKLKSAWSIVNWSRHAKHRQENYDACHPVDFGWRARLSLYITCRWPFILKRQFIVCKDSCIFFHALLYRQKDRVSHLKKPARQRRLIALPFSHSNLSQEECPLNSKP